MLLAISKQMMRRYRPYGRCCLKRATETDLSELEATARHLDRLISEWALLASEARTSHKPLFYLFEWQGAYEPLEAVRFVRPGMAYANEHAQRRYELWNNGRWRGFDVMAEAGNRQFDFLRP